MANETCGVPIKGFAVLKSKNVYLHNRTQAWIYKSKNGINKDVVDD